MFVERRINPTTQKVELWKCEWENIVGSPARKISIEKISDEQTVDIGKSGSMLSAAAICWSYGRTLGNIAVTSPTVLGAFNSQAGSDAVLPCDFVNAGKYRNGADRWWCRTHQAHWGTKADLASLAVQGGMLCGNHDQLMNYVVSPYSIEMQNFAEVGIWCSMPPAMSTNAILPRPPKIHVHLRKQSGGSKSLDKDFDAIAINYSESLKLFGNTEIVQVNVTPPAAIEFVRGLEEGREMGCVNCSHCGYPHLDLGDFAENPHRKHFCANCGRDSTWSKTAIVSTPLKPLHDQFDNSADFVVPQRSVSLDQYPNCSYNVWSSTPAVLWTAKRPQEKGIHVHVHDGTKRIVDDTFAEVIHNGKALVREDLLKSMLAMTII